MTSTDTLSGTVIRPGDPGYDERRAVFNAMIDRRSALILRCTEAAEVAAGICYARAHDLALSPCAAAATTSRERRCATAA